MIKVNFDDGQVVHKGDVLVVIDPTDYTVALERARADYEESQAQAEAARYGVPVSSSGIVQPDSFGAADRTRRRKPAWRPRRNRWKQRQSQVVEAEADAQKLNTDVERYRQLLGKREISQQQFDAATAAATAANATVQARQAALLAARAQVKMAQVADRTGRTRRSGTPRPLPTRWLRRRPRRSRPTPRRCATKSALDQAQLNLSYTTITAPVDGVVGKRSVQVGSNVAIGQDLMAIVPLHDVWVTANFKETQLAHMCPGQPVKISVDTYGGRKWEGHVSNIGGATGAKYSLLPPENATGNYVKVVQRIPVRIDFDGNDKPDFNKDGLLRPGMSVEPDVRVAANCKNR